MNPTWTVPRTILEEDILPKLHQDRSYLRKKGLHVLDFNGNPVDETEIDWSLYPEKKFPYMLRQEPGPGGALGRIKFMFPNEHSIYLHDTPYRSLFDNNERAFSSGCIRIEKPYELAELLLRDTSEWNRDAILDTIDSLESRAVSLPEAVTIILFYWTAGVDENGHILFRRDIYDRDRPIVKGLSSRFRFRKKPILDGDGQAERPSNRLIPASLTQAVRVN
jgi:murein L,D-transpeptidase YcbB/YkuD